MEIELIKVLIADDHAMVRDGLKMILEDQDDIKVIGEAETGLDTLNKIIQMKPDVALLDINMPEMNGIEVARDIFKQKTSTKIIFLSMYSDEAYVVSAIKAGVSGYLLKQSDANTMIEAIRSVNQGKPFYSPSISDSVLKAARAGLGGDIKTKSKFDELSPREKQILCLIAEGLSSVSISNKLFISSKTVDKHRQNLMNKLEIHDVVSLSQFAVRQRSGKDVESKETVESHHFTIVSKVYIYPKSVGRKIMSIEGVDAIKKYLGYSNKEIKDFFNVGKRYDSVTSHPYLKILEQKEQDEIRKSEKMMSKLYDVVSTMTIEHSNVVKKRNFIHKNGQIVQSVTDDFFSWENKITTQKIRFLTD